ncbi:hypothetical protein C5C69_01975, partial [Rathayibacter sp. AY1C7]|uniref:hypothetical protein n=1 Tax=Rathayibacter sp. AY1C7 TaxID=2080540 RepID=UPI000D4E22B1
GAHSAPPRENRDDGELTGEDQRRRTGVVIGLLAPLLANAGLTPLAALVGPAVFGAAALVLAGELAVVAVLARRR